MKNALSWPVGTRVQIRWSKNDPWKDTIIDEANWQQFDVDYSTLLGAWFTHGSDRIRFIEEPTKESLEELQKDKA